MTATAAILSGAFLLFARHAGFIARSDNQGDVFVHQVREPCHYLPKLTCPVLPSPAEARAVPRNPDLVSLCPNAQSDIKTDGFRSLREGEQVFFTLDLTPDGREKAANVTGPGGAPVQVPAPGPSCFRWQPTFASGPPGAIFSEDAPYLKPCACLHAARCEGAASLAARVLHLSEGSCSARARALGSCWMRERVPSAGEVVE